MAENLSSVAIKPLQDVAEEFLKHQQRSKVYLSTFESPQQAHPLSDFYNRLKTYQPAWWVTKPLSLSPWFCARYGWICVEKNLLQCVDCKSYLSSHLPSITDINLYQKCCDRFRACLNESHSQTCVWRSTPVPLTECTPNIFDRNVALNEFLNRYQEIVSRYPNLNDVLFENHFNLGVTNDDLSILSELINVSSDVYSKQAAILALFGWKVSEKISDALFCNQCFRTVGLWLFRQTSLTSPRNNESDDDSMLRRKRLCTEKDRVFCPEKQHYSWCPWVFAVGSFSVLYISSNAAQNPDAPVPRWRALLCLLKKPREATKTSENNISLSEHFVTAKQLLEETIGKVENFICSS